jgi:predicted Fe-Mo cluster-binding NifX family protein
MKIAVASDGNQVSVHFGRCPQFTILELEDGKIAKREIIDNPGHRKEFLPEFFHSKGVNCIIAGGMGTRASELFEEKNIKVIVGIIGDINKIIDDILEGKLKGGESLCEPGKGKGYGIEKEKGD